MDKIIIIIINDNLMFVIIFVIFSPDARLTKRGSWRRVALLCPSTGRPQRDGDVLGSRRQLLVADAKTVPEEEPPEEELIWKKWNIKNI